MNKTTEIVKTTQKSCTSETREVSNVGSFDKKNHNRARKCLLSVIELLRSVDLLMNYAVMRALLGNANVPLSIQSLLPLGY